jgi:hypothetical protein
MMIVLTADPEADSAVVDLPDPLPFLGEKLKRS